MTETIGFIGLGRMGGPMASRLIEAGHKLYIMDPSDAAAEALVARGAVRAFTPSEIADAAELVFSSLPSPAIVRDIATGEHGLIHGSRIRRFVDLSTIGQAACKIIAEQLSAKSIAFLDAPVSGGIKGAREGTLAIMVGGGRAHFEELRPILSLLGKLFFMGETPGSGQTMKLANNIMAACAIAITSEAMAMGIKGGLDPATMIEVLNVSSGRNSATQDKWPRSVLPRSFDFGFATGLSFKDVRLGVEEAEALGVPMIVGSAVRQMLSITNQIYGADSDFTAMAKVVERWAGIQPEAQSIN
ncbi:NAD(P)-dependent oxidoreductase [Sphingomonas crusticola]|uniref:NAD(P)-dependent oxidoreductase n=1 Tax=Sphingomonas crusticola TaxID=1697973 RepID=UPI000E259669|nr:NAD(P)-dependent oxidoreductase [Sphingomonas crusticola]